MTTELYKESLIEAKKLREVAADDAKEDCYLAARRWLFFGLVAATTLVGTAMMLDIVRAAGVTVLVLTGAIYWETISHRAS